MDIICRHHFIHLDELKSSTYILNSFKIMDHFIHIDEWQIENYPIVMWHVTISFIMGKLVTQLTFWLLKIQLICQNISLHWKLTQTMHVTCMVAINIQMCTMNYLFSQNDIENSLHSLYVSKFYRSVGEHNKKMSSKK